MSRTPPVLSDSTRAEARQRALRARRMRAELKDDVRAGRRHPSHVIDLAFSESEEGRAAARMTIGDLLLSLPGLGEVGVDRLLVDLRIDGDRRLRALGHRQRDELNRALR